MLLALVGFACHFAQQTMTKQYILRTLALKELQLANHQRVFEETKKLLAEGKVKEARHLLEFAVVEEKRLQKFLFVFERLEPDFFRKVDLLLLSGQKLSHLQRQIIALIRMGMGIQEAASFIGVEPKSFLHSRRRIKKKFDCPSHLGLDDFIMAI